MKSNAPKVVDSRGKPIRLGQELGKGGEGSVFQVLDNQSLVAKVYHRPIGSKRSAKLTAMSKTGTDRLLKLAAWPLDTLSDPTSQQIVGMLMPKVGEHKPIHELYSPRSRLVEFPEADWRFLVAAATNVARAFRTIHDHGHVIGDVNHDNIMISNRATATVIDCDSFQISTPHELYLCEVGVQTHTAPELQGRSFQGVIRTRNHDAFGLAVLLFQLLFLGRHPFSGRFLGSGEMPLERAIKECRYAYSRISTTLQMTSPPGAPSTSSISTELAELFERAFARNSVQPDARPKPSEWIGALERMSSQVASCSRNGSHYFLRSLNECPWCEIEILAGTSIFKVVVVTAAPVATRKSFDLARVWAEIQSVPIVGHLPAVAPASLSQIKADQWVTQLGVKRRRVRAAGIAQGVILVVVVFGFSIGGIAAFSLLSLAVAGFLISNHFGSAASREARQRLEPEFESKKATLKSIQSRWQAEAGNQRFTRMYEELERARVDYLRLPVTKQSRLQELHKNARAARLKRHLESHRIDRAGIHSIGPVRIASLQSYGIETAADVREASVLGVPGFGPLLARNLVQWRLQVEQRFVFNPAQGVDQRDIADIEREIQVSQQRFERELIDGAARLRQQSDATLHARKLLQPPLEAALIAVAQAEVNLRAL